MNIKTVSLALLGAASLTLAACGDKDDHDHDDTADHDDTGEDTGDGPADIAIAGSYTDGWGGDHEITNTSWAQYGGTTNFAIVSYDNDEQMAIAQNDSANAYNPDLWSRFDWHTDGDGNLWYCQGTYDAATQADAESAAAPDTSDPANSGCGTFSWTQLTAN